jgi:uncharacterized protein GlcG (DUF336 family)
MPHLDLETAQKILATAVKVARERDLKPMGVVVLDSRASLKAALSEDGSPIDRWKIAFGKANGALALGFSSRRIGVIAVDRPHLFAGLATVVEGGIVPVAGAVLIRNAAGNVIGAAGASGDTSDNDEALLVTAVESVGLIADVA